jgi:hypothetical protein
MRKVNLGADTRGNWNPRFVAAKAKKPADDREGRGNTTVLSYYPTIKGERRMELLRRYSHVDMAHLLDAWPHVLRWTADTQKVEFETEDGVNKLTPDFEVDTENGRYVIRLIPPGVKPSPRSLTRHEHARELYGRIDTAFVVHTSEEVAQHPDLPAARELFEHRMREWPEELPGRLSEKWSAKCPLPLGTLHAYLGGSEADWFVVLSLAAHGHLRLGIDGPILPETPVLAIAVEGYRP